MKPFNLQEALAGKPVVTRDGRKVEQLFYFDKAEYNNSKVRAVVDGSIVAYTDNGSFYEEGITASDLFMASEKREYWVALVRLSKEKRYGIEGIISTLATNKEELLKTWNEEEILKIEKFYEEEL